MQKNYLFSDNVSKELQEWLGLTKADILIYIATALVFVIWIIQVKIIQWGLILAVITLCFFSTKLGIEPSQKVSKFTNVVKLISYPFFSIILVGIAIFASFK